MEEEEEEVVMLKAPLPGKRRRSLSEASLKSQGGSISPGPGHVEHTEVEFSPPRPPRQSHKHISGERPNSVLGRDDTPLKDFLEIKVIKITYYGVAGSGRLHFVNHHSNCGGAAASRRG